MWSQKEIQPQVHIKRRYLVFFVSWIGFSSFVDQTLARYNKVVLDEESESEANTCKILKPGGKLILECPNLVNACKAIIENPQVASLPDSNGQMSMWPLYGDPSWQDPLMVHKWAYTPDSLIKVVASAGFSNVKQEKAKFKLREPRDMRVTGINQ